MVKIIYSLKFEREYRKLPLHIKDVAEEKFETFKINPFDPQLRTHKLSGGLRNYWAFSISYKYRIVFSFLAPNQIKFHAIGTHSIYK